MIGAALCKITLAISHNNQAKRPRNPTHLPHHLPSHHSGKERGSLTVAAHAVLRAHPYRSHSKHRPQDTEGDRHDGILAPARLVIEDTGDSGDVRGLDIDDHGVTKGAGD